MANGYITPGDGGLEFQTTDRYVDMSARLPTQPAEWTDNSNLQRYRITTWRQLTLAAGTDTTEAWHGWPGTSSDDTVAGAKTAAWVEYDASGQDPAEPAGASLGEPAFTSTVSEPRQASYTTGPEAHLTYLADTRDGELLAIYIEMENDNALSTSDPSSVRAYETIGRNTGTWTPYDANESCSAWLMQRVMAQNLNKILFASKQCWTVPV